MFFQYRLRGITTGLYWHRKIGGYLSGVFAGLPDGKRGEYRLLPRSKGPKIDGFWEARVQKEGERKYW